MGPGNTVYFSDHSSLATADPSLQACLPNTEAILISPVFCTVCYSEYALPAAGPSGSTSYYSAEELCSCQDAAPKGRVRQPDARCLRAEQPAVGRLFGRWGGLMPEEVMSAESQIHSSLAAWNSNDLWL